MLFKRKRNQDKEILALTTMIADLRQQLYNKDNQVTYLIKTIREMDDILFSISQCTNWESMRPRIATLTDQMTARKVTESRRINSIITNELIDVYSPKQLSKP